MAQIIWPVTEGVGEKAWVPLDASFKQYEYTEAMDISSSLNFDFEELIDQLVATATIDTTTGSISNIDENLILEKLSELQQETTTYVEQNYPDADLSDLLGRTAIVPEQLGLLPNSLPTLMISIDSEWHSVPSSLRASLAINAPGLAYEANLSELAGKSLTLAYVGATSADKDMLSGYSNIAEVPAYMVDLLPIFLVDGEVVATGVEPLGLGEGHAFDVELIHPGLSPQHIDHTIIAGSYYALALNLGWVSKDAALAGAAQLEEAAHALELLIEGGTANADFTVDDLVGKLLYLSGTAYFAQLDAVNTITASMAGINYQRDVSFGMTGVYADVDTLFGIPTSSRTGGLFLDIKADNFFVVADDANSEKTKAFVKAAGIAGSYLEGILYPRLFGTQAEGVSTMSLLRLANTQGIPIYNINQENVESAIGELAVPGALKDDIVAQVNQGLEITIPKTTLTTPSGWTGTGYIVSDPQTGAAGYMISGGLAGGHYGPHGEEAWAPIIYDQALLFVGLIGGEGVLGAGLTGLVMTFGPFAQVALTFLVSYYLTVNSDLTDEQKSFYTGLLIVFTGMFMAGLVALLTVPDIFLKAVLMWFTTMLFTMFFGVLWPVWIDMGVAISAR